MSRIISGASLVYSQLDFFQPAGSINRLQGVVIAQLSAKLFTSNSVLAWPLADGSSVLTTDISSGTIYFNEIQSDPGYYSVRFLPDRIGFWRLLITHSALSTEIIQEYDVVPASASACASGTGLVASFTS